MQIISDADKKIWMDDDCDKEWTIKIYRGEETEPKYTFTNDDIQDDSLEIEAQLFEGQKIVFGGCYARSLKLNLPRYRSTVEGEDVEPTADDYEEIDYQKKDRITVEATASVDGGPSTEPLYLFWGYIDSVTSSSGKLVKEIQAYDILAYINKYDVRALWNNLLRRSTKQLKFSTILNRMFKEFNTKLIKDKFYGIPDDDENAANLKPLSRKTDLFKNTFPDNYCYLNMGDKASSRKNGLQRRADGKISPLSVIRWFCNIIGGFGYIDPQDGKFDILTLPSELSTGFVPDYYKTAEYYNTSISPYNGVAFGLDGYYLDDEDDSTDANSSDDDMASTSTNISSKDHIYAYGNIDGNLVHQYTHKNPELSSKVSDFYGISNNLTQAMLGPDSRKNIVEPLQEKLYNTLNSFNSYNPATIEFNNCLALQLGKKLTLSYTEQYPEGNTKDISFIYLVSHILYSGFSNTTTKVDSGTDTDTDRTDLEDTSYNRRGRSGGTSETSKVTTISKTDYMFLGQLQLMTKYDYPIPKTVNSIVDGTRYIMSLNDLPDIKYILPISNGYIGFANASVNSSESEMSDEDSNSSANFGIYIVDTIPSQFNNVPLVMLSPTYSEASRERESRTTDTYKKLFGFNSPLQYNSKYKLNKFCGNKLTLQYILNNHGYSMESNFLSTTFRDIFRYEQSVSSSDFNQYRLPNQLDLGLGSSHHIYYINTGSFKAYWMLDIETSGTVPSNPSPKSRYVDIDVKTIFPDKSGIDSIKSHSTSITPPIYEVITGKDVKVNASVPYVERFGPSGDFKYRNSADDCREMDSGSSLKYSCVDVNGNIFYYVQSAYHVSDDGFLTTEDDDDYAYTLCTILCIQTSKYAFWDWRDSMFVKALKLPNYVNHKHYYGYKIKSADIQLFLRIGNYCYLVFEGGSTFDPEDTISDDGIEQTTLNNTNKDRLKGGLYFYRLSDYDIKLVKSYTEPNSVLPCLDGQIYVEKGTNCVYIITPTKTILRTYEYTSSSYSKKHYVQYASCEPNSDKDSYKAVTYKLWKIDAELNIAELSTLPTNKVSYTWKYYKNSYTTEDTNDTYVSMPLSVVELNNNIYVVYTDCIYKVDTVNKKLINKQSFNLTYRPSLNPLTIATTKYIYVLVSDVNGSPNNFNSSLGIGWDSCNTLDLKVLVFDGSKIVSSYILPSYIPDSLYMPHNYQIGMFSKASDYGSYSKTFSYSTKDGSRVLTDESSYDDTKTWMYRMITSDYIVYDDTPYYAVSMYNNGTQLYKLTSDSYVLMDNIPEDSVNIELRVDDDGFTLKYGTAPIDITDVDSWRVRRYENQNMAHVRHYAFTTK